MSETKTQVAPSPVAGEGRGAGSISRHLVRRAGDANFVVPPAFVERSRGFKRWGVVGEESPAVHTGFALCTLDADGWVAAHVHSYEESIFMMEGEAELTTTEGTFRLLTNAILYGAATAPARAGMPAGQSATGR